LKRQPLKITCIGATIVACLLVAYILGAVQSYHRITSRASVKCVGVEAYTKQLELLTDLDWGILTPGQMVNYSFYLKNISNVPVTVNCSTSDWNPPNASQFITFTWTHKNETLAVDQVVECTFYLYVSHNISGIRDFAFDITLKGEG